MARLRASVDEPREGAAALGVELARLLPDLQKDLLQNVLRLGAAA